MELKIGDKFKQNFPGGHLWFKVISLDRPNNSITVDCYSPEGYSHQETWDDLDVTEMCFEGRPYGMSEYILIEDTVNYEDTR